MNHPPTSFRATHVRWHVGFGALFTVSGVVRLVQLCVGPTPFTERATAIGLSVAAVVLFLVNLWVVKNIEARPSRFLPRAFAGYMVFGSISALAVGDVTVAAVSLAHAVLFAPLFLTDRRWDKLLRYREA